MADILTAVLIPLVGVVVAFYPPSDNDKLLYVAGFVAVSVLAIVLMRAQRKRERAENQADIRELRDVMREEFAEAQRIKALPPAQQQPSPRFVELVQREHVLSGEAPPPVVAAQLQLLWGAGNEQLPHGDG